MVLVLLSGTDTSPFIEIKETSYGFLRESDFLRPSMCSPSIVLTGGDVPEVTFTVILWHPYQDDMGRDHHDKLTDQIWQTSFSSYSATCTLGFSGLAVPTPLSSLRARVGVVFAEDIQPMVVPLRWFVHRRHILRG